MKVKIALETMSDITDFVSIVSQLPGTIHLTCGAFKVNAKSLLGVLYTMEWDEVWCESENDIYTKIEKFVV